MSVGSTLQAARIEAGLSVQALSGTTRVPARLVAALERDDFAACGAGSYVRGHLRAVAAALALDPQPLIRAYEGQPQQGSPAALAEVLIPLLDVPRPGTAGAGWVGGDTGAPVSPGLPQVLRGNLTPQRTGRRRRRVGRGGAGGYPRAGG